MKHPIKKEYNIFISIKWCIPLFYCSKEIREGGHQLLEKLQMYRPLIAVFNGKGKKIWLLVWIPLSVTYFNRFLYISGIYEIFSKEILGVKAKNLEFGLQPYKVPDTDTVWVSYTKDPSVSC